MTSKPTRRKDVLDSIINLKKRQREINGLNRQNFSGLGSSAFGSVSGTASSGSSGTVDSGGNDNDYRIKSSGDTMIGPLAFAPKTQTIASGIIDVSESTGSYSSRVYIIGQGSAADNLEVILGAGFAGQILFFQPITAAITLQSYQKTATAWASGTSYSIGDVVLYSNQRYTCYVAHTSSASITPTDATKWYRNNIRITGATEQVVAIDEIILLQYDSTDGVWTVVSGGGSGSGGWDGDATSILDMNDYAIQHTGQISFGATSGTYANIDSSSDSTVMNFAVNGLSAMALTESSGDSILELKGSPNPVLKLRSTDGTPSDNQTVGGLYFDAFNSSLSLKTFGSLKMETADVTAGSEDGAFMMNLMNGGTSTNVLLFDNDRLLPQTSDDYDLGGAANRFKFAYIKFPTSVEQLSFSSAISGQYINSSTAGLQYYVPSGDSHVFEVVSTPVVTITATQTTFHDDVEVVGNLDNGSGHNDNFVWSGTGYANISATNTYLYSATTYLGNSGGGDLTYIYSELDFKANHSSVNQTLPTHSDGYITIKVGGITRKLYYYN